MVLRRTIPTQHNLLQSDQSSPWTDFRWKNMACTMSRVPNKAALHEGHTYITRLLLLVLQDWHCDFSFHDVSRTALYPSEILLHELLRFCFTSKGRHEGAMMTAIRLTRHTWRWNFFVAVDYAACTDTTRFTLIAISFTVRGPRNPVSTSS